MCLSPDGTCAALVSLKEDSAEVQIAVLKYETDDSDYTSSIINRCA